MHNKIIVFTIIAIALVFSLFVAVDIAAADYEQLGIYAAAGIAIYFFLNGWRNVWWFAALLIFSGVVFYHGFVIEADHLFVLMIVLASAMSLVTRSTMPLPQPMRAAGSRSTLIILGALLLYGAGHFMVNMAVPYDPTRYSLKTTSKAYFEGFASMAAFFWLLGGNYGFRLRPNWSRVLIWIIFLSLAGNVAARGYMYLMGFQAADGLSTGGLDDYFLYVPVINMQAGIYTLRNITPIAFAILMMTLTAPGWWRSSGNVIRFLVLTSLGLCLVGAVFSGGRATLLFCIAIAAGVALVRRRILALAAMAVFAAAVIGAANLFSHEINNKAPYYIARSLQLVMLEKGEAYASIEDSQDHRTAAIEEAIKEWKKDNRTLIFGRSVFSITFQEALIMRNRGLDGFVDNAMRSGRTHNLVTDLLLQYGVVGLVLYCMAYVAVIRYVWKMHRNVSLEHAFSGALAGALKIYLPMMFVYQLLGGTFMPMTAALLVGLIRADLVLHPVGARKEAAGSAKSAAVDSPEGRTGLLGTPVRS